VNVRRFEHYREFKRAVLDMMSRQFLADSDVPYAVILPGGVTPLDIYESIASAPCEVSEKLHLIISDERYVEESSDFYNFGKMRPMIDALGLPPERVIRVDTSLGFEGAADDFDSRISAFLEEGVISLAFLGLGADGHTASLFTRQDIYDGEGKCAIPVKAHEGPDRISLTKDLLSQSEKALILTSGAGKDEIISRLEEDQNSVVAGIVLKDVVDAEVWYSLTRE
jgi:6-phosphogluconolactonase